MAGSHDSAVLADGVREICRIKPTAGKVQVLQYSNFASPVFLFSRVTRREPSLPSMDSVCKATCRNEESGGLFPIPVLVFLPALSLC